MVKTLTIEVHWVLSMSSYLSIATREPADSDTIQVIESDIPVILRNRHNATRW